MHLVNEYNKKEPLGFEGEDTFVLMKEPEVLSGADDEREIVHNPLAEQQKRIQAQEDMEKLARGEADPTKVCLNRSEYRGIYIDAETGKKFRPGVPTEVGKIHAQRLLALRNGKLFTAC